LGLAQLHSFEYEIPNQKINAVTDCSLSNIDFTMEISNGNLDTAVGAVHGKCYFCRGLDILALIVQQKTTFLTIAGETAIFRMFSNLNLRITP
jgi:hypothetical protein